MADVRIGMWWTHRRRGTTMRPLPTAADAPRPMPPQQQQYQEGEEGCRVPLTTLLVRPPEQKLVSLLQVLCQLSILFAAGHRRHHPPYHLVAGEHLNIVELLLVVVRFLPASRSFAKSLISACFTVWSQSRYATQWSIIFVFSTLSVISTRRVG